jgi:hypothetical protein
MVGAMNALALFIVVAVLLFAQDYFMPSSMRMVASNWMGYDLDQFYTAYRSRFPKRAIVILLGSAAFALSIAWPAPDWVQIVLLITAVASHGVLVLFDIVKSRHFG